MKRWKGFDYVSQWDGSGLTHRPAISVTLLNEQKSIQVTALIDSGCDCVMANKDIAEALGITSSPLRRIRVGGVTGLRDDGFKFEIKVQPVSFGAFPADVTFVPNLPFACLLGQRDFFDSFNVRFEKTKRRFYLQRI